MVALVGGVVAVVDVTDGVVAGCVVVVGGYYGVAVVVVDSDGVYVVDGVSYCVSWHDVVAGVVVVVVVVVVGGGVVAVGVVAMVDGVGVVVVVDGEGVDDVVVCAVVVDGDDVGVVFGFGYGDGGGGGGSAVVVATGDGGGGVDVIMPDVGVAVGSVGVAYRHTDYDGDACVVIGGNDVNVTIGAVYCGCRVWRRGLCNGCEGADGFGGVGVDMVGVVVEPVVAVIVVVVGDADFDGGVCISCVGVCCVDMYNGGAGIGIGGSAVVVATGGVGHDAVVDDDGDGSVGARYCYCHMVCDRVCCWSGV